MKIREFQRILSYYGLKMGMTDEELAEYEDKPLPEQSASDGIDWEQRRWELSLRLYLRDDAYIWPEAIELADEFIEAYKQSLNKEE